jgi:hypothetical protein
MGNLQITATLNGDDASSIAELNELTVQATFDQGNPQAEIETQQLTFVNEYATIIKNWLDGGLNGSSPGYSEGIPFEFNVSQQGLPTTNAFKGCLDMREGFRRIDPTTYVAKMIREDGIENLQGNSEGLTWELLYQQGVINDNDFGSMPYVIEKEFNFVEFATVAIATYMTAKETHAAIQRVSRDAAAFIETATGSAIGLPAALIGAAVRLVIEIIFTAILLVNLIRLVTQLISYLISPVKFHKFILVDTLMNRGSNYLDYTYNTSIPQITNNVNQLRLAVLPSKTNIDIDDQAMKIDLGLTVNQPGVGYPSSADFGYTFAEMIKLNNDVFNAKVAIKNGVIQQHSLNSSYWLDQSTYTLPPVLDESIAVNMDETVKNYLIEFARDKKDVNTVINFTGTTYEVITEQINGNIRKNEQIRGLNRVQIPYALGNRKEGLNAFERFVKALAEVIDDVIDFFGGTGNNAASIDARVGMLKLETDFLDVPKLMLIDGAAKLPANNRAVWSAKVLWDQFHIFNSFVGTSGSDFADSNQWRKFENLTIPMGYADFLSVVDNSYLYDCEGHEAQITKLDWSVMLDSALSSGRVRKVWSKNFKETKIEV